MKMKHTPGPWKAFGVTVHSISTEAPIHGDFERGYVADTTSIANANLIAQAPAMYDWMKRMAPSWDEEAKKIITKIERG
jgi:hypothetical protein